MSSIIEKVETFIQRLHDLDYVIDPKASTLIFGIPSRLSESMLLSDFLAKKISEYEENRDNERNKLTYALSCLMWINRAFTCGVIHEGQGLARKLKECQEKNTKLDSDLERVSMEYLRLKEESGILARNLKLPDEDGG
jgi:hypothetical protein